MSDTQQFRYGHSVLRLASFAILAACGVGFTFYYILDDNVQLFVGLVQLPQPVKIAIAYGIVLTLLCTSLYHIHLLLWKFLAPKYVTVTSSALTVPISDWHNQLRTIELGTIQKVVGPRAGKLEVRASDGPFFLETAKFQTKSEFQECCQLIFQKLGITRDLRAAAGQPPRFLEIARKFSTSRLGAYYGSVVASADAFFLVRLKNYEQRYKGLDEGVANFFALLSRKDQVEISISELPEQILDDPDWPLWDQQGGVRVVPKSAVQSVRLPWWGELVVLTAEYRFSISVSMLKQHKVRKYLRETGWDL